MSRRRRCPQWRSLTLLALLGAGACGSDDEPAADASVAIDAPAGDGAITVDALVIDAAATCPMNYAGCATYVDRTADSLVSVVTNGDNYTPPCIRVRVGTQVRIEADAEHPMYAAPCSPQDFVGAPQGGTQTTATYTLPSTGTFGYYCPAHGGSAGNGMAGAILVVP